MDSFQPAKEAMLGAPHGRASGVGLEVGGRMKTITEMAREAGWMHEHDSETGFVAEAAFKFAELVRADERRRITNLMLYMHNKASPYHNYYKHAAVEINRKDGEGEKI